MKQNYKKLISSKKLDWTIIRNNMTIPEFVKRYNFFHRIIKYWIVIPGIKIIKKIMKNYLVTPENIERDGKNKIFMAWVDNFEDSLKEWCYVYRRPFDKKEAERAYKKYFNTQLLRDLNSIMIGGLMEDAPYRTFFEMLSINWAIKINKLYPNKITHFVYNLKTIDDKRFMAIAGTNDNHLFFTTNEGLIAVKKEDAIKIRAFEKHDFYNEEIKNGKN